MRPNNLPIAVIGFGALGRQITSFLELTEKELLIYDDNLFCHTKDSKKKLVFPFNNYLGNLANTNFIVGLGYKDLKKRQEVFNTILKNNGKVLGFTHNTAFLNKSATLGKGVIIYPRCNIDQNVVLGDGVLINNSVVVSHDSIIGDHSYLSPGVIICGNVSVGKRVFIGAGSIISNGVKIGDDCKLGIGSVITRNLEPETCGIGNPFRYLKDINLK